MPVAKLLANPYYSPELEQKLPLNPLDRMVPEKIDVSGQPLENAIG